MKESARRSRLMAYSHMTWESSLSDSGADLAGVNQYPSIVYKPHAVMFRIWQDHGKSPSSFDSPLTRRVSLRIRTILEVSQLETATHNACYNFKSRAISFHWPSGNLIWRSGPPGTPSLVAIFVRRY